MATIRVQYVKRNDSDGSDFPTGHLEESQLFNQPHWRGNPRGASQEFLFRYTWSGSGRQSWLCYLKALPPKLICLSHEDERSDWKIYIDDRSYVREITDSESSLWFKKNGREFPRQYKTKKRNDSDLTLRQKAILKIIPSACSDEGLQAKEIANKLKPPYKVALTTIQRTNLRVLVAKGLIQNTPPQGYRLSGSSKTE